MHIDQSSKQNDHRKRAHELPHEAERWLTLAQAASATGRSRVTIRRYLDKGLFPGARRESGRDDGRWQVPATDLVDLGLPLDAHRNGGTEDATSADPSAAAQGPLLEAIAAQGQTIREQAETIRRMAETIAALVDAASPRMSR